MRRIPDSSLWMGHLGDARDLRSVLDAGIQALVDLAVEERPLAVPRELVYCRFPLLDGAGNPPWLVMAAVRTVADLLVSGVPTLVYCSAGMSRTPVIAAAALSQVRGCPLAEALKVVAETGPADVSPGLLAEVRAALERSGSAK